MAGLALLLLAGGGPDPVAEADLQVAAGQRTDYRVAPLHQRHRVAVDQLVEAQVLHLVDVGQPVHVEVVDGQGVALVAVGQGERG